MDNDKLGALCFCAFLVCLTAVVITGMALGVIK